jgi:hypothetical protein
LVRLDLEQHLIHRHRLALGKAAFLQKPLHAGAQLDPVDRHHPTDELRLRLDLPALGGHRDHRRRRRGHGG